MDKNKVINKRIIWVAGLTLATVFIWVALDSYHQLVRRDRVEDVSQMLIPLNPELEKEVLDKIRQRREHQIGEVENYLKPELITVVEDGGESEEPEDISQETDLSEAEEND